MAMDKQVNPRKQMELMIKEKIRRESGAMIA